jgi:hypothetical protein
MLALLITLAAYWFRRDIVLAPNGQLRVEPTAGRHLAALGAFLFVVTAAQHLAGAAAGAAVLHHRAAGGRQLQRPERHAAGDARLRRGGAAGGRRAPVLRRAPPVARGAIIAVASFAVVSLLARGAYPGAVQRLVVAPDGAHARGAVPPAPHRGSRARVGAGRTWRAARSPAPSASRWTTSRQHRHRRERAAVGPRAAAPDVRAAPGDPDLLRLRFGRRRPLLDRRPLPAGAALRRAS